VAPPLFETLVVLGREACLKRIDRALHMLPAGNLMSDPTPAPSNFVRDIILETEDQ
jgi:hypothetical protein